MKIFSLSLILLLCANSFLFAQVDEVAVETDSAYVDISDAATAVEMVGGYDYTTDGSYSMPDDELEKFNFKKGKPVFVVVNVQHSRPNDSLLAVREMKELQKNFKHLKADFFIVHDNSVLKFENHDQYEIRFDDYNSQYQSVIFWDGKTDSDIFQMQGMVKSSEGYSEILGVNKTSSYIEEFNRKKAELSKFKNEIVNQKSAAVSQKYISHLFLSEVYYLKNEENFFPVNFKGVKKLTVKSNYKQFKNPVNEAEFDTNGNPTKLILQSDDSDGKKIKIQFSYLSGALKKMVSSFSDEDGDYKNEEEFYYQDGNLYETFSDNGSFSKHYIDENGFLLSHSYFYDEYRYFIMEDDLSFNGKTLSYRDYGNLNDRDYTINSLENFFPVKVKIRGDNYDDIVKISSNEYKNSEARILIDNSGRIIKVIMENLEMEDEPKPMDLIFEYFYEYY